MRHASLLFLSGLIGLSVLLLISSYDPSYARSDTATPGLFNSTTPDPATDPPNRIANGSLDVDDFGLIENWADIDIDLYRWYLVQDVPLAPEQDTRWVERVDLSWASRGYGLRSIDNQACDYYCSTEAVQIVRSEPGYEYTLSADSLVEEGNGGALYLDFLNADRQRLSAVTQGGYSDEWDRATIVALPPAGTEYIRIILYTSDQQRGTVYWDNVSLTAKKVSSVTATPVSPTPVVWGVNVAANKPVIARAGGVTYAPWGNANDALDYNSTTKPEGGRWGIETNAGSGTFQVVDLLAEYDLTGIGYSIGWDQSFVNNLTFEVAVSLDNYTWTTVWTMVHETMDPAKGYAIVFDTAITTTRARYVRYWEPPDGEWNGWGDIISLRAYAAEGTALSVPSPTPTILPTDTLESVHTPTPTPATPGQFTLGQQVTVNVVNDTLNVRSAPGLVFNILEKLEDGTIVTILEGPWISDDGLVWWRVRSPREIEGWTVESADGILTLLP